MTGTWPQHAWEARGSIEVECGERLPGLVFFNQLVHGVSLDEAKLAGVVLLPLPVRGGQNKDALWRGLAMASTAGGSGGVDVPEHQWLSNAEPWLVCVCAHVQRCETAKRSGLWSSQGGECGGAAIAHPRPRTEATGEGSLWWCGR